MIYEFIIALVIYDSLKFVGGLILVILNKESYEKEVEINNQKKTFEEKLREKMKEETSTD